MSAVPNWRLLVYPPTGSDAPTVIPRDRSFMLSAGIRMQVTPEGDCREASFNARGAGVRIPPLSGVRFQVEDSGNWVNLFYGEVRQGGNPRDLTGENYILRSFVHRLKEVTLPAGFSTPRQAAHLTVKDIMMAVTGDVAGGYPLGNPCVIDPVDFSLIQDLGFEARPITDAHQQTAAAFLDQIVQDGAGMNVEVRYGVNADGKFFCCTAATAVLTAPMTNMIRLQWKAPVAEAPCTAVLWFVARRPDGRWITHRSIGPGAATYGQRVRAIALDPSVEPWVTLDIQQVRLSQNNAIYTNLVPVASDSSWADITASAKEKLTDGATADTDSSLGVSARAKGVAVEVTAAEGVQRYVVYGGTSPSSTRLTAQGVMQVYSGSTVAYVDAAQQGAPLVLSNADPGRDAQGNLIESTMRLAEVMPQKIDTDLLDRLARYYYTSPAIAPADIELRSYVNTEGIGTITIPDAPGGEYTSPVDAWEIRIGRSINSDSLIVPTRAATGILGRELPSDLYPRCISGAHPGFDFVPKSFQRGNSPLQTLSLKRTEFQFGHAQP